MILRTALRIACFGTIAVLVAQDASAYNWNKCRSNKQNWDSNNVTFRPSSVSFPAGSGWRTSVESMRSVWNTAPGTRFDFTYSYSSSSGYSSGDGTNSILITSSYDWNGALGVARRRFKWCVWPFWGGKIKEVDILFNPAYTWSTDVNPTSTVRPWSPYNSTLVGIHELGHAFGLDHEDNVMATMNSYYPNSGPLGRDNDIVPHGDDVLGNRAGYGTSGSPRELYASTYRRTGAGTSDIISAPSTMYRATSTGFQFSIGNRGAVNETSVGVKFYLSTDRTITTSDYLVGSAGYSMNQGTTVTRTVNVTANSSIPAGYYYFGWIVDPENYIGEGDEGNNSVALAGRTRLLDQTPPNACFSLSTSNGQAPLTVSVNASCSNDPDGTITSYTWDMGNGVTRTGSSFSYTYWDAGSYTIRLTVRDDDYLTDQATRFVYVYSNDGCDQPFPDEPILDANGEQVIEPCLDPV
ncbi:MAG: PKD domain-containing protein [Acidobacteriota bacterium]